MTPEEIITLSINYRGSLLHEITQMEIILNVYLMQFFCGENLNRQIDMQNLILGDERINLGAKVQIIQYIIENYDKNWGLGYISIVNNDRKKNRIPLNVDLVKLIEHRNIFAHRILDAHNIALNNVEKDSDTVRFIKFKDEILPLDYDKKKFDKIIECIRNITNYFNDKLSLK